MDNKIKMTAEQALEWLRTIAKISGAVASERPLSFNYQEALKFQAAVKALSAPRVPAATDVMISRGAEWLNDHGMRIDGDPIDAAEQTERIAEGVFEAMLAASPEPVAPQPKGRITNQGAVYSQAEAWQSVVEALDALQPGWILQVGKTATESAVELIRDWQADAAQYHVVMAEYTTDIYSAAKSWPEDIRAKLSIHDLRRMNGWRAPKHTVSMASEVPGHEKRGVIGHYKIHHNGDREGTVLGNWDWERVVKDAGLTGKWMVLQFTDAADFERDWSLLEATQDSLREHSDLLKQRDSQINELRAEVEALKAGLDGLIKASDAVRADLLCRAKKDSDGIAVVDVSHSKWDAFKKSISDAARLREEGE